MQQTSGFVSSLVISGKRQKPLQFLDVTVLDSSLPSSGFHVGAN